MSIDEKYMWRCLQLARNGRQNAAPNPMVGAVVVHQGVILGEGYHVRCGEGHAEVNAIAAVKERDKLCESTIYVSLEPCSHYGKTPPCVELILSMGIPRVVVGCLDPFPEVAGRGVKRLRDAGVEVVTGVLAAECLALNRQFVVFHTQKRPFITLKWAESADGFMDEERESDDAKKPVLFSTPITQMWVHKRRVEHQAILVGSATALLDNPSLTARYWPGRNPLRIVIDRQGELPLSLQLFDGNMATLVVQDVHACAPAYPPNIELVVVDFSHPILPQLLHALYVRNIQSLLVEGGAITLQNFIDTQFWDEIVVETSAVVLSGGVKSPVLPASVVSKTAYYGSNRVSTSRRLTTE